MAFGTYIQKDGALRIYDGSPTPYYLELFFVNSDFVAPTGRPRYEERLVLDRGTHKNNPEGNQLTSHYIRSTDDATLEPVELSWSMRLANTEPNRTKFRQALNTELSATFTVGTNTWITTKGTTTVLNSAKTAVLVSTPTFTDPRKRTVTIEILWLDPTSGVIATGFRWAEVYFPPERQTINETDDQIQCNCVGMVYGEILQITGFTTGVLG
jgi:hypothetical protein